MAGRGSGESRPAVTVVGGGVIGITTATALELAGYDTAVYADRVPFQDENEPTLATPYAGASVKPASVTMADLPRVLERSEAVFGLLREAGSMGVRRQPHYQVYEEDRPDPVYADVVTGFDRLADVDDHPRRSGAEATFGWRFDVHFAETPTFLVRCYDLYEAIGGVVDRETVSPAAFLDLPGDVVVNCAGLRAPELVDDPRPMETVLGHQVVADGLPMARDADGRVFSYTYATEPGVDAALAGQVYSYPRTDVHVLGGSRVPVDGSPGEDWNGEIQGPTRTVDGVDVPARIVETNADLLASSAGIDLADADLSARYGYRPVRDPDGAGVRLERETIDGREVVHNYGHGGAGVALSWGSAAEVVDLARDVHEPEPRSIDVPPEFAVAERLAELVRFGA